MTREEAIKKIKLEMTGQIIDKDVRDVLEALIPELRESEDEKIRKSIVDFIKSHADEFEKSTDTWDMLAWLEKQKEQKLADRLTLENPLTGEKVCEREIPEFMKTQDPKDAEAIIHLTMKGWTVIAPGKEQKPAGWSEEDEKMRENLLYLMLENNSQDSWEGTYEWLKSLHPSWKPDNEKHDYITPHKKFFQWIYDRLIYVHKENPDVDYMRSFKERINNLSFEDKCRWKPSKKQMDALWTAKSYYGRAWACDIQRSLESLYDDLEEQCK